MRSTVSGRNGPPSPNSEYVSELSSEREQGSGNGWEMETVAGAVVFEAARKHAAEQNWF